MNQSSLLLRGMIIIAISVLFVLGGMLHLGLEYSDPSFPAKWYPYEVFLAVMVVTLWYLFLKKDIPLNFRIKFNRAFFITLPIFLVPFSLLFYVLLTSETLDSEQITMYFATAVTVGIAEEMIFRVAGYRVLVASGSSAKRAILLSALLFSLFHLTNIAAGQGIEIIGQLINTFMLGVVFAYIYYRTESILYIMILHFMWDFALFMTTGFGGTKNVLVLFVLFTGIIYFIWAITNVLKLKKSQ